MPKGIDRLQTGRKPNHSWRPYRRDRSSQSSNGTVRRLAATFGGGKTFRQMKWPEAAKGKLGE